MKKIITLVFAVIAAGVAVSSCSLKASTPTEAAKQYFDYVAGGQYDKFVNAIAFPAEISGAELKEQKAAVKALMDEKVVPSLEEKGGLKSMEVISETLAADGMSAYIEALYTYGNGETSEEDMDLVLVDGRWLVDMGK